MDAPFHYEKPSSVWTKDPRRDELLRQLHASDAPFSEIAYQINVQTGSNLTRNACIGRAKRMGLASRQPAGNQTPRGQGVDGALVSKIRTRPTRVQYFSIPELELPPSPLPFLNISFADLSEGQCKYPQGGDGEPVLFCGQDQRDGSPYCHFHTRVCWAGIPARNKQKPYGQAF